MYDFDITKVNATLVEAIKLTVACRRMLGKGQVGYDVVQDIERGIREAAAECQRVLGLIEADANRPLING